MVKKQNLHERGKIHISEHFKNLNDGESVAIIKNRTLDFSNPERLHGSTGKVVGKRGRFYLVKMSKKEKERVFIVNPAHLRRIQNDKRK